MVRLFNQILANPKEYTGGKFMGKRYTSLSDNYLGMFINSQSTLRNELPFIVNPQRNAYHFAFARGRSQKIMTPLMGVRKYTLLDSIATGNPNEVKLFALGTFRQNVSTMIGLVNTRDQSYPFIIADGVVLIPGSSDYFENEIRLTSLVNST